MPFDGTGFPERPEHPRRATHNDNVVTLIIVMLAFALLALPISMGAFVDIVRSMRGG